MRAENLFLLLFASSWPNKDLIWFSTGQQQKTNHNSTYFDWLIRFNFGYHGINASVNYLSLDIIIIVNSNINSLLCYKQKLNSVLFSPVKNKQQKLSTMYMECRTIALFFFSTKASRHHNFGLWWPFLLILSRRDGDLNQFEPLHHGNE